MTTNTAEFEEDPPLTPTNNGKVQFLGPDTVRYISPPRIEVPRQSIRPPLPPAPSAPPPPSYQASVYPQAHPTVPVPPMQPQIVPQIVPQVVPQTIPQIVPQMMPQLMPQPMQMPMQMMPHQMMTPMTYIPQMMPSPPVMISPPTQQQVSPSAVTLNINTSPQSVTSGASVGGAAGGGALICPKCRKGIVTRQQDRWRKKLLMFCGIFCCPITCGIPLICLCCNYVDACACCGMNYGHRGRKAHKKKVNAVKI